MANSGTKIIAQYLNDSSDVDVAWLYGSRAKGNSTDQSDFDIAVALAPKTADRLETLESLRFALSKQLDVPISIVDINKAPVPLTQNVVAQGKVIVCKSDFRLRAEQQRVWSLWESYKWEHEHNRQAL